MGSPIFPMMVNIYMGLLKEIALNTATTTWYRYIDDHHLVSVGRCTNIAGPCELSIQLTMEEETKYERIFADVVITRIENVFKYSYITFEPSPDYIF